MIKITSHSPSNPSSCSVSHNSLAASCAFGGQNTVLNHYGTGATDTCELLYDGCWEPNRDPLEEQHVLLTCCDLFLSLLSLVSVKTTQ